ncbi:MAG: 4Fe-4S binding protein [Oscillospiraceae bacterium]|nr:4Fe-4S binding protein [Oscillospiraceae bacterium]
MPISVRLDKEKCKGCTRCVKQCPVEAIRVRFGHAKILENKCIDCGQCVRACPQRAKKAVADPLERMDDFKHTIVLPAPALYGQFHNLDNINVVLQALLDMGFDEVFEVAAAADMISDLTARELYERAFEKPVISSACPAVVRLIRQRFPNLIPHISRHIAPVELAAKIARERAVLRTGLSDSDIGVFFVTPCPAKVTEAHNPIGLDEPVINYAVSMADVYKRLLPLMKKSDNLPELRTSGLVGVGWAVAGGESAPLKKYNAIACDGLDNVIKLLDSIEDGQLPEVDYIELSACVPGCVGGCFTVENPFAARSRIVRFTGSETANTPVDINDVHRFWRTKRIKHIPSTILDEDFGKAIQKLKQIDMLTLKLPGLDCGSCGTPGCHALAQDVILGYADESDCIFNARDSMDGTDYLPPPFRRQGTENS